MKLLVQSDDYAITKAVSLGIIEAIKNGILRNTGIFMNMPWSLECAEMIKPYLDQIALGVDVNISTGSPLLDPKLIPSLCQDNGKFLTSSMNRALDTTENNYDHINYEETCREFEAQVEKYIEVFNKKPDYLQNHAFLTPTKDKALSDTAKKYGIPYTHEIVPKYTKTTYDEGHSTEWYLTPYTLDNQANAKLKDYILSDKLNLLNKEYGFIICHCGYVDRTLMDLSSFNIFRLNDLDAITSKEVKDWVKNNNIELITYKDLKG